MGMKVEGGNMEEMMKRDLGGMGMVIGMLGGRWLNKWSDLERLYGEMVLVMGDELN